MHVTVGCVNFLHVLWGIYFQPLLVCEKSFCVRECLLYSDCVVSPHPVPAFVPAPPVAPVPSPAPMPPVHPPPPMEDEPVSKKLKSEDSLIPEEEFLRRNKVRVSSARVPTPLGCSVSSVRRVARS